MSKEILVTLPDQVYRQAQQISQVEQRPLNNIIEEILTKAFPAVYVHPQRAKMKQEQAAFQAMKAALLQQYAGQYVAVHHGEVVDHDPDQVTLALRINEQYPDTAVLIKKVSPDPDKILHMRSPRFLQ
jgi:isopentenyl phosphate kinase